MFCEKTANQSIIFIILTPTKSNQQIWANTYTDGDLKISNDWNEK